MEKGVGQPGGQIKRLFTERRIYRYARQLLDCEANSKAVGKIVKFIMTKLHGRYGEAEQVVKPSGVWVSRLKAAGPILGVLVATLAMLVLAIDRVVDLQVENTRRAVERDLSSLQEFASSQSAAFAGTSFIGYSVGRYYGFAPAFTQISPDPERAAVMLRAAYGRDGGRPADLPPALLAYDTVHERFHPSFVSMLAASVFDDLFLVDRLGRVVYSLRKDAAFGVDLRGPRFRELPLAQTVRAVMARVQQEEDPTRIVVVGQPRQTEDGPAILLGRPIVRHGAVEGVAVFRLPARIVQQRLDALEQPGLRLTLLDGDGRPLATEPGGTDGAPAAGTGAAAGPAITAGGTSWTYVMQADRGRLAGGLNTGLWLVLAGGIAAVAWTLAGRRDPVPAAPLPTAMPAAAMPAPVPAAALRLDLPTEAAAPPPSPDPVEERMEMPTDLVDARDDDLAGGESPGGEPSPIDSDEGYRRCLVDTMSLTLDCWQKAKGKGKIELAEESGVWRVYMDRSSLQTRTLDKYLLVETLPRNPRWRDVVRTAEYVLRHCPEPTPERQAMTESLIRLKQHLRMAERI